MSNCAACNTRCRRSPVDLIHRHQDGAFRASCRNLMTPEFSPPIAPRASYVDTPFVKPFHNQESRRAASICTAFDGRLIAVGPDEVRRSWVPTKIAHTQDAAPRTDFPRSPAAPVFIKIMCRPSELGRRSVRRNSLSCCRSVDGIVCHDSPNHSSHLVGQGDRGQPWRLRLQQLPNPFHQRATGLLPRVSYDGGCADNQ